MTTTRSMLLMAGVAVAYVAAAAVGFQLAFVAEQITTVWAPTGIALAALVTGGLRLWPAVWVGALVANAGSHAPVWTAVFIATGNTLEAVAGTWWLRRHARFEPAFQRVNDVVAFVVIAAAACTAISATIGVATLCVAAVQPWARFPTLWFDWWLGDALGALVVAPAILTGVNYPWSRRAAIRAAAWIGGAVVVTHLVFGQVLGLSPHPLEYVVFPLIIAVALVGGPPLTSQVVLSSSAVAIWHTVHGAGPFASAEVHDSLVLLQVFMGILAGTALLLAAAIAERRLSELRERDAAADVRDREAMLRLAQRAGGVATFEWDFRNQVARCSAEFFRIFGLPAEDGVITATEWGRFVHPDDRDRITEHLARALDGTQPAAADYRIVAADGRVRWLSYAGQIEQTPRGDRMLGTVVDITDRKELEAELRHHAAEVERILETIGEGFTALDRQFRFAYVNAAAEQMIGRSRATLIGRTPWDVLPETIVGDSRWQLEAALKGGVAAQYETYIPEWNRWFESRVYPSSEGLSIFFADVTQRKRVEIALRDAKAAAESANQLKDHFLATVSHELRTPLNAILGYARLLQREAIPPDKRQRAIDVIERNAVAQHQLVEDLLDMSRITTGTLRLDAAPVPVVAVLREAIEGIKPAADAKGIALEVDFDPFAGSVRADTTRLQQVFSNLLSNAVKFTGENGRIVAALRRTDEHVEVLITDTGAGISSEFLPFVFEPFRQAESRVDRGRGGLGLGLAITKQLVELHGGTIEAASAGVGRGATFTVRLPCVVEPGVASELDDPTLRAGVSARPLTVQPLLSGVRILLVEDEEDTLQMFRDALEGAGAHVRAVGNGVAALRATDAWQPDLLVTDLGLPGMDGYELLRTFRSTNACPAVAVSAYARLEDRSRALAAGFHAHIAKPVAPDALVLALRTVLLSTD